MPAASVSHVGLRFALLLTILVLGALTALSALASPSSADDTVAPAPDSVPDQLVVGFDEDSSGSQQRNAVSKAGGRVEDTMNSIDSLVVEPRGRSSSQQIASRLSQSSIVDYVEPNYILRSNRLPNDVLFNHQWALHNTGQLSGKAGSDINAPGAWDLVTGGEVTVAVIDTGIDQTHPDLNDNLWANPGDPPNGIDDDRNGWVDDVRGIDLANDDSDPFDDSGHGTHVAGIIGAEGNNGIGTTGVAWKARLISLKFLDANGEGNTADAATAIDYAVRAGARVVNASWGGPAYSYALFRAIRNAASRQVMVVAASGNEGRLADSYPEYPAAFDLPNVISVAATDTSDLLLDFSNYGPRTVDLGAPGDEIYSTVPRQTSASGYASFSGTSMAAPQVSGAAALYLARTPTATSQQLRDALLQSVDPLPSLAGKTVSGGRLNVARMFGIGRVPDAPAGASRDLTAPSPFRLISPRNRYRAHKKGLRFRWQRSRDTSGIRFYRLFVDGKKRRTVRDPDGPGGRSPSTRAWYKLGGGRHRWHVRAYDYAGNSRKSRTSRRKGRRHATRVLFISPQPHARRKAK